MCSFEVAQVERSKVLFGDKKYSTLAEKCTKMRKQENHDQPKMVNNISLQP